MSLSVDEQQTSDTTFQVKVSGVSYFASFSSTGTWVDSVAGLAALCILHSRILLQFCINCDCLKYKGILVPALLIV